MEEEVRLGRAVVGLLLPATLQLDMDMQDRVTVYQVIITVMFITSPYPSPPVTISCTGHQQQGDV